MQKKVIYLFILGLLFLTENVFALSPAEVKARGNVCEDAAKPFELSVANVDGTLTKNECFASYKEAKTKMDTLTDEKDVFVIIEGGVIIDATYALVDYDQKTDASYTRIYSDKTLKSQTTYVRALTSSDDAALLEMDYETKRIKIKVNNVTGWIAKYEYESTKKNKLYDIVPISWVKQSVTYKVTEKDIIHNLPLNVYGDKETIYITLGPKPEMLEVGLYYSYDGIYFYKDLRTMIKDYKNNTYTSSINKDKPYYNYYLYLPFRSKTNYNGENLEQYIVSRTSNESKEGSKLRGMGANFIKYQDLYGVNGALMLSIGINESAWGTSEIAQKKNNLFGLKAYDESPGESADYFPTVEKCIDDYSYGWLAYGYLQPGDYRFKGGNLGTKGEGLNVHYASDVYWGEIAASIYYDLDKFFGLQDYNSNGIAVLNDNYQNKVYPTKTIGGVKVSEKFYQFKVKHSPVLLLEEKIVDGVTWYKIMSDPTLMGDLEYGDGSSQSNPRILYGWEKTAVYVPASYFIKVNEIPKSDEEEVEPPIDKPEENPEEPPVEKPEEEVPIQQIVEEAKFIYQKDFISGIKLDTTIENVKKALSIHNAKVEVQEENGNNATGIIKTGQKITIVSGNLKETLTVILHGDTNGDGLISAVDYVKIKNHIMGTNKLTGVYQKSADVNKDNNISAVDYVNIKNYIMGKPNVIK